MRDDVSVTRAEDILAQIRENGHLARRDRSPEEAAAVQSRFEDVLAANADQTRLALDERLAELGKRLGVSLKPPVIPREAEPIRVSLDEIQELRAQENRERIAREQAMVDSLVDLAQLARAETDARVLQERRAEARHVESMGANHRNARWAATRLA